MACRLFRARALSEPMKTYYHLRPQGTHFNEILFEIQKFSFKKMHLKMSSAKVAAIMSRPQSVKQPARFQSKYISVFSLKMQLEKD